MTASAGSPLRVGTRASALALAQTTIVAKRLAAAAGRDYRLVTVTTVGDTSNEPLADLGGTGVFASALRETLVAGECDVIVHSLKDLPTEAYPGLVVGAIPKRADARDALCARDALTLDALPAGARVGTGSPRRRAQLQHARADLAVVDIRGNVDTRLGRLMGENADLDAVVLAAAGLDRLGRSEAITEMFSLSTWPTAPGQGALALEVRAGDEGGGGALAKALASVDSATTNACVTAERGVLAGLEAGCSAPIGATAMVDDGILFLTATVFSPDGTARLTSSHAASLESTRRTELFAAAHEVAGRVVAELLASGAPRLAPLGSAS